MWEAAMLRNASGLDPEQDTKSYSNGSNASVSYLALLALKTNWSTMMLAAVSTKNSFLLAVSCINNKRDYWYITAA